jgi:hypothetical protein
MITTGRNSLQMTDIHVEKSHSAQLQLQQRATRKYYHGTVFEFLRLAASAMIGLGLPSATSRPELQPHVAVRREHCVNAVPWKPVARRRRVTVEVGQTIITTGLNRLFATCFGSTMASKPGWPILAGARLTLDDGQSDAFVRDTDPTAGAVELVGHCHGEKGAKTEDFVSFLKNS